MGRAKGGARGEGEEGLAWPPLPKFPCAKAAEVGGEGAGGEGLPRWDFPAPASRVGGCGCRAAPGPAQNRSRETRPPGNYLCDLEQLGAVPPL